MPNETGLSPELIGRYTRRGYWSDTTVGERLDHMIQAFPNKTAIVDSQCHVTYAELGRMVESLATGLNELGIEAGDRVTAQLPNRVSAIVVYFAVAKIGSVLCPIVPYYRAAEACHILERTESVAFVLPDTFAGFDYLSMLQEIRPALPHLKHVIVDGKHVPEKAISLQELMGKEGSKRPAARKKPGANDPLAIMFTSGTEAAPKAPIWTHNTVHNIMVLNSGWGFTEKDTLLCLAPMYHAFGLSVGCHAILAELGATCVWLDAFEPNEALRVAERERATAILGVPPQLTAILDHPNLTSYDLSALRLITTGAAPMPAEAIRRLKTQLGCGFVTLWGATESVGGPITRIDDPPEVAATTVGRAANECVEIAVFDETRQNILPVGQAGEMAVRGPFVFAGYYKDPELTGRSFHPDGWFFTGDSVVVDERGYVSFVSRIKDIINRGGEKISAREVEEHLYSHPKVLAVAMVGMPDRRLGERNCVYVVPRGEETLTLEEMVSFLQERGIAKVKLPERLEVVDSLPMNASGKVRKNILREDIASKIQKGL